ncbi:hypothetical protein BGN33_05400 [Salmonella enterica subsp. enterica serovar Enteritidis]|nr:hypothetical protein [Salmonella enterica subsp. enterica serovar Enteritidis]
MDKKVEMRGICGRPAEALKIKDRVSALLNLVPNTVLVACWDIIDTTMLRFEANLRNNSCWSPALSVDDKVYLVNETTDKDNNRIDRWRFALHDNVVSIDVILSITGESCIAVNEIAAYAKLKLAQCFHSRVRGFDMPVILTINGHDGSGLFEFHYDPDNENTEE